MPKTHYKSLSKNNYLDYIKSKKKVTYKKYLYAFRGLINALWVYHNNSIPPLDFVETLDNSGLFLDRFIYEKLKEIIDLKSQGKEKDIIPNIDVLDEYIESFLNKHFENLTKNKVDINFINTEIKKIIL